MPTLEDFQNILDTVEQSRVQQSALYRKAAEAQQQQQEQKQQEEQQMDAFFAQVFERAKRDQRIRQYEEGFRKILHKPQQPDYGIMPLVRACGGVVNRFDDGGRVTQEDLDRNSWRWASVDELQEDDPLFKSLDVSRGPQWIVDSEGRLVPKSKVETWLNSYERQTPYQVQNDNAADEWVRKRMADRFVGTLGITDWTNPQQRQNFWDLAAYTAMGAGAGLLGGVALPAMISSSVATGSAAPILSAAGDVMLGLGTYNMTNDISKDVTGQTVDTWINRALGINDDSMMGSVLHPAGFISASNIKGAGKAMADDFVDSWRAMCYAQSHPEAQIYGIKPVETGLSQMNTNASNITVDPATEKMKQEITTKTQEWLADVADSRAHVMQQYPGINYGMLRRYPDLVDEVSGSLQPAHMDIPGGTPRAQWMEERTQRKNALSSMPDMSIGEVFGYDFSANSAPTFLNEVNDLMQSRIAAGKQPGIMMRNSERAYDKLNDFGQVNWGTDGEVSGYFVPSDGGVKLPFGNRIYTWDEVSKWKTPETVKKQIDNRLDRLYETMNIPEAERAYTKIDKGRRKFLVPSWQFIFDKGGSLAT